MRSQPGARCPSSHAPPPELFPGRDPRAEKGSRRPRCGPGRRPSDPRERLRPVKGLLGLGVLDSDLPLSQVLAKAAWAASGQPSRGRGRSLNFPRSLARVVDFCWVEPAPCTERVFPKLVLKERMNESESTHRGQRRHRDGSSPPPFSCVGGTSEKTHSASLWA